jgi:hypothetical protein
MMRRGITAILVAGAIAGGAIITVVTGGGGPVSGDTAQLWIDTNGGSCARTGGGATYNDATACSSMQTALAACTAGDTIRMKAGTYGSQSISAQKTSPGCTVIGDTDSPGVATGGITFTTAAWVGIQNVHSTSGIGFDNQPVGFPHDLTFTNLDTDGINFWSGGNNITWNGGDIGPTSIPTDGAIVIDGCPNPLTNVTLDGIFFHDNVRDGTVGQHTEVVRIDDNTDNVKVRDSTFDGSNKTNSSMVLIGSKSCTQRATNVTFENNFFSPSIDNAVSLNFGGGGTLPLCTGLKFKYITITTGASVWLPANCTNSSSATLTGNLGPKPGDCGAATYVDNAWTGGTCGASDASIGSTGLTGDGYHLSPTSAARGSGSPTDCPATDHDGDVRPLPAATICDAGADEVQ